jgi:hypothetical protein
MSNIHEFIKKLINGTIADLYNIDKKDAKILLENGFTVKEEKDNGDGTKSTTISDGKYNFIYFEATS